MTHDCATWPRGCGRGRYIFSLAKARVCGLPQQAARLLCLSYSAKLRVRRRGCGRPMRVISKHKSQVWVKPLPGNLAKGRV
jgi:hypothetical protein